MTHKLSGKKTEICWPSFLVSKRAFCCAYKRNKVSGIKRFSFAKNLACRNIFWSKNRRLWNVPERYVNLESPQTLWLIIVNRAVQKNWGDRKLYKKFPFSIAGIYVWEQEKQNLWESKKWERLKNLILCKKIDKLRGGKLMFFINYFSSKGNHHWFWFRGTLHWKEGRSIWENVTANFPTWKNKKIGVGTK